MMTRTLAITLLMAAPAGAATFDDPAAYCRAVGTIDRPDSRYTGPAVPEWMAAALMRATGAPPTSAPAYFEHARWRCDHGRVLACSYGANIPCDSKADTSRKATRGARTFCEQSPGAEVVPEVATGHATIYAWRCAGTRPVIVRQVLRVDRRDFPAAFWHHVTP